VADDIKHTGDANTYLSFDADSITSYNGGTNNLSMTTGAVVFNEGGGGVDFRVEASGHTHALFVEGSTGHVGIGNATDPGFPLHIVVDENYPLYVAQSGTNHNLAAFRSNGAGLDIAIRGAENRCVFNSITSGDDITFETNDGNERVRILAAGGMTFNGDTAAANGLDDYEEGTFSPRLHFDGATTGIAYSSGYSTGWYIKIGDLVTFNFTIILSSKGSANGSAQIRGLPFALEDNTYHQSTAAFIPYHVSFADQIVCYLPRNNTAITLRESTNAGNLTDITNGNISDDSQFTITGSYKTTA
jgi:hypothetical protein